MWKFLAPFAKNETQFRICNRLLPIFIVLSLILLIPAMVLGLAFAPADYQQGDSFRIMYVHVPTAIWSMGIYVSMAICGFVALVWQIKQAHMAMIAMAPVGLVWTFLALITGAIWGKPMWGAWWVWDARLTSELILFFLYIGVLALYSSFDDRQTGTKAASLLALIGVVNIPIIHFSVVWWNTLHQGASITKFDKPSIAPEMLLPLILAIFGFLFLSIWLSIKGYKNTLLEHDYKKEWVNNHFNSSK